MLPARRGIGGDILSFQLERSLALQEGIDLPCAGGLFYGERLLECLAGVEGRRVTGEVGVEPSAVLEDVRFLVRRQKGVRFCPARPVPPQTRGRPLRRSREREQALSALLAL